MCARHVHGEGTGGEVAQVLQPEAHLANTVQSSKSPVVMYYLQPVILFPKLDEPNFRDTLLL